MVTALAVNIKFNVIRPRLICRGKAVKAHDFCVERVVYCSIAVAFHDFAELVVALLRRVRFSGVKPYGENPPVVNSYTTHVEFAVIRQG